VVVIGTALMDIILAAEVEPQVDVGPGMRIAFTTAGGSSPKLAKRNIHKYLAKPFNLDEVLAFLAEALRNEYLSLAIWL
jgi:hypothetical protein